MRYKAMHERYGQDMLEYMKSFNAKSGETMHKFRFDNGYTITVKAKGGNFECKVDNPQIKVINKCMILISEESVAWFLRLLKDL